MGPWKPTARNMENLRVYHARMDRARALDPSAFRPIMIPTFTDDQRRRQIEAIRKAGGNDPLPTTTSQE